MVQLALNIVIYTWHLKGFVSKTPHQEEFHQMTDMLFLII